MSSEETLTTREAVIQFLKLKPSVEFKSGELAAGVKEMFPVKFENKKIPQLAAEIIAGSTQWLKQSKDFHKSEETPWRYWWDD